MLTQLVKGLKRAKSSPSCSIKKSQAQVKPTMSPTSSRAMSILFNPITLSREHLLFLFWFSVERTVVESPTPVSISSDEACNRGSARFFNFHTHTPYTQNRRIDERKTCARYVRNTLGVYCLITWRVGPPLRYPGVLSRCWATAAYIRRVAGELSLSRWETGAIQRRQRRQSSSCTWRPEHGLLSYLAANNKYICMRRTCQQGEAACNKFCHTPWQAGRQAALRDHFTGIMVPTDRHVAGGTPLA